MFSDLQEHTTTWIKVLNMFKMIWSLAELSTSLARLHETMVCVFIEEQGSCWLFRDFTDIWTGAYYDPTMKYANEAEPFASYIRYNKTWIL